MARSLEKEALVRSHGESSQCNQASPAKEISPGMLVLYLVVDGYLFAESAALLSPSTNR